MCNIVRMAKGVCPLCGSEEITYDPISSDMEDCLPNPESIEFQEWRFEATCDDCGCRFDEIYEPAYVGCDVISQKGKQQ